MSDFATVDDVIALWRDLSIEERERISALLPVVSDSLREEARKVGKNLDEMIAEHPTLGNVARSVTVDVVARVRVKGIPKTLRYTDISIKDWIK